MQMVLTLQFSAALELTNDGGEGKVSNHCLAKTWPGTIIKAMGLLAEGKCNGE